MISNKRTYNNWPTIDNKLNSRRVFLSNFVSHISMFVWIFLHFLIETFSLFSLSLSFMRSFAQNMWQFTFRRLTWKETLRFTMWKIKRMKRLFLTIRQQLNWPSWRVHGRPSVSFTTNSCTIVTARTATKFTGDATTIRGISLYTIKSLCCFCRLSLIITDYIFTINS